MTHEPASVSASADQSSPDASHLRCGVFGGSFAAVVGAVIAWGVLVAAFPVFKLPPELANVPVPIPTELAIRRDAALLVATRWNTTLIMAVWGALVAGGLAGTEAIARRCGAKAVGRSLLAAVIAGAVSAAAGLLGYEIIEWLRTSAGMSPLAKTTAAHGIALGLSGLGIGVAAGLGSGSRSLLCNAAAGGALGGVLAGLIYPIGAAYLLPAAQTERLVPHEPGNQCLWLLGAALLMALTMTGLGRRNATSRLTPAGK